jgi:hypothetical protein
MVEEQSSNLLLPATLIGFLLGLAATIYFFFGLAGYVTSAWLNLFIAASLLADSPMSGSAYGPR